MLWSRRCTYHCLSQTMTTVGHMVSPYSKGAVKCGRTFVYSCHIFVAFKFRVQFHTVSHEQSKAYCISFNQEGGRKKKPLLKDIATCINQGKQFLLSLCLGTMNNV